jgi:hypothetical protein
VRRTADCIEGGYFRASRPGLRRCFYCLGVGWWVFKIEMVSDCIEGGYFGASRLGLRRCFYRLEVGRWVFEIEMV